MTQPFVQGLLAVNTPSPPLPHESLSSHACYQMACHIVPVLVFQSPLLYLINAPKQESSDASNSDMPERSWKVLPASEKVNIAQ